jgi:hypothetical protein
MLRLTRLLTAAGIVLLFVTHLSFRGGQSTSVATVIGLTNSEQVHHATTAVLADRPGTAHGRSTGMTAAARAGACPGSGTDIFDQLELNGAARRLWGCVDRSRVQAVMLTFGSKSMSDFLINWVEHVRRLGVNAGPYLVRPPHPSHTSARTWHLNPSIPGRARPTPAAWL